MPFEDFVVADADMHVMEPADLWQRYIAPEYQHAAPIGMTELRRDIRVKLCWLVRVHRFRSSISPRPPAQRSRRSWVAASTLATSATSMELRPRCRRPVTIWVPSTSFATRRGVESACAP